MIQLSHRSCRKAGPMLLKDGACQSHHLWQGPFQYMYLWMEYTLQADNNHSKKHNIPLRFLERMP